MNSISPYLNFDGETREAMKFYADCLGADLDIKSFGDVGMGDDARVADRTMHARLSKGPVVIMASDSEPGARFSKGNNVFLSIDCESVDEVRRLHNALGAGGTVLMEPQDTFWGAHFSMITDRFGVGWMFNHELPSA